MTITKPRTSGGRRGRRNGRRGGGRRRQRMRTEAEQLDYEMELLKAQREGREEEFKTQEREKLRARKAQQLDDEMDDYFKKKEDAADADKDPEKKDDQQAQPDRPDSSAQQSDKSVQPTQAAAN